MMLSKLHVATGFAHTAIPRAVAAHLALSMKARGPSSQTRMKSLSKLYKPRSVNQQTYVSQLASTDIDIVIGVGPAGTGKTLFACSSAVDRLRAGSIGKLIITRPVVSVEEDIGFLPGNLVMKMDPWTRPIFDILLEFYSQKDIDLMIHAGTIEIAPLAYMRGRTFKRAFVIADEMQNSSPSQMLMLMTRLGEGSKLVITGDLNQSDRMKDNGLRDLLRRMKGANEVPGIGYVELAMTDVERSPIVRRVLDLYEDPAATCDTGCSTKRASPKKKAAPASPKTRPPTPLLIEEPVPSEWESVSDAAIIPRHLLPKQGNATESVADFKWIRW